MSERAELNLFPGVRKVWRWEGQYGAEAAPEAERRPIAAAWLYDAEGIHLADCTDAEVERLTTAMRHHWLFSVVKRDHDYLDPDDCGGFHSDGSGKRSMSAWFIDASEVHAVADAVILREDTPRGERARQSVPVGPDSST